MIGGVASFLLSFMLYPKLVTILNNNNDITQFISTYTDSNSIIGDLDLSSKSVETLSNTDISAVVGRVNLPPPLDQLFNNNLQNQIFAPFGDMATNVGDYASQTIISVCVNVASFLICFVACYIVITIVINLIRAVFRFPVLKHLDALFGGVFGLLIGVVFCYALFTLLPLLSSLLPMQEVTTLIEQSQMAKLFSSEQLILSIMNRT